MIAQALRSIRRVRLALLTAVFVLIAASPALVHSASATYEYDTKGRVSRITYDDGTVVDYTYSFKGNRTGATKTTPPPDTTPPSAPGTPSFSNITMTSARASWTAATDNKGVVGYDYKVNAGAWQSLSNVLLVNLTNLSPATSYTVSVRARCGDQYRSGQFQLFHHARHTSAHGADRPERLRAELEHRQPLVECVDGQRWRHRVPGLSQR